MSASSQSGGRPASFEKIEFYRHELGPREIESVAEVINSIFLTTGPKTKRFEDELARYLGVAHAVGVTSGTTGLFLALKALGIGEGDEVITTPMSFIATANSILHAGATPVFVDVEPDTGNLNVDLVEKAITSRTRAVMPVHLYGVMVDMKRLRALADAHRLKIIEDAAHCLEGTRDGARPGQLGDVAVFSFYATKNLACGEGGALVTNDPQLAQTLRTLRLHGMTKEAYDRYTARYQHYDMTTLGYKANMFDVQAALLLPQLARIDEMLRRRRELAAQYERELQIPGLDFPRVPRGAESARYVFTVWAPDGRRDEILGRLQDAGIGVAVNFRAIHLMRYYRERFGFRPGAFLVAERIGDRTLTLPLYPKLLPEQVSHVARTLRWIVESPEVPSRG